MNAAALVRGETTHALPRTTALGALAYYVSHADARNYQPTNIAFGILPSLDTPPRNRLARKQAMAERALADLDRWMQPEAVEAAHASGR
jgi:methylenetetrahydrofolate--tRNA-(uracil-5-)-methyltransferase